MSTNIIEFAALVVFAVITAGCAMSKPPLQRDKHYSAEWPDISSLGMECQELDGSYANEGVVAGVHGDHQTILLTSILPIGKEFKEAKVVSLKVVTRKKSSNQDTFATLQVIVDGDERHQYESSDCFCIQRTFFYSPSHWGGGLPLLFVGGGQRNVWLTKATDGSLIAKIWDYTAGIVVVVPFHKQNYVWARFRPIRD